MSGAYRGKYPKQDPLEIGWTMRLVFKNDQQYIGFQDLDWVEEQIAYSKKHWRDDQRAWGPVSWQPVRLTYRDWERLGMGHSIPIPREYSE